MSLMGDVGSGMKQTLTGNIETAQLIIHDYRPVAERAGVGMEDRMTQSEALSVFAKERVAATMAALDSGSAPVYPSSVEKVFKVQFNPSQLTLNASLDPKQIKDTTSEKSTGLTVHDAKLIMTVILMFDDVDTYDSFVAERFTSGLSTNGIANMVKAGMDIADARREHSVQPQVEALVAALRNPYTRNISFRWADFSFIGQLTTVQAKYTMFSTSGRPVRAQVLLRMQHERDPVMLQNWYADFDKAFGKDTSLTAAGQAVGNLLNF